MYSSDGDSLDKYLDDEEYQILSEDGSFDDEESFFSGESIECIDTSLYTFDDVNSPVCCIDYYHYATNEKYMVATGSMDNMLRIYTTQHPFTTLNNLINFNHYEDSVVSVKFNADGSYIGTGSYDEGIKIYTVQFDSNNEFPSIGYKCSLEKSSSAVEWIEWYFKGNILIAGLLDGSCWMWNVDSQAVMHVLLGHSSPLSCGQFIHTEKLIVTGDTNGNIIYWDCKSGQQQISFDSNFNLSKQSPFQRNMQTFEKKMNVTTIDIHQSSALVAIGFESGFIYLHNAKSLKHVAILDYHNQSIEGLSFNQLENTNHLFLASGCLDGKICIWDSRTFKVMFVFTPNSTIKDENQENRLPSVTKLQWLNYIGSSCILLLSSYSNGNLNLWDIHTQSCLYEFTGHRKCVLNFCHWMHKNKLSVVSCSDDRTVKLWSYDIENNPDQSNHLL